VASVLREGRSTLNNNRAPGQYLQGAAFRLLIALTNEALILFYIFADCFSYAAAVSLGKPLLCKGDDFIHTDVPIFGVQTG